MPANVKKPLFPKDSGKLHQKPTLLAGHLAKKWNKNSARALQMLDLMETKSPFWIVIFVPSSGGEKNMCTQVLIWTEKNGHLSMKRQTTSQFTAHLHVCIAGNIPYKIAIAKEQVQIFVRPVSS